MISNLRHQLKMLGKENQMERVLDEIVQVRAELGYPIMVTPFAQFVGSQAAINVITGERYKSPTRSFSMRSVFGAKKAPRIRPPKSKRKSSTAPVPESWKSSKSPMCRWMKSAKSTAAQACPTKNYYCASTPAPNSSTP